MENELRQQQGGLPSHDDSDESNDSFMMTPIDIPPPGIPPIQLHDKHELNTVQWFTNKRF
jgi:hypothetical protein